MFNLIRKDFRIHLSPINLISYMFITFIALMVVFHDDVFNRNIFIAGYVGVAASLSIFTYDEKTNFYVVINSLPVKKSNVVKARYISSLILMTVCMAVALIVSAMMDYPELLKQLSNAHLLKLIIPYFVIIALSYPMHYRMPYRFARIANAFIFVAYFLGMQFLLDRNLNFLSSNTMNVELYLILIVSIIIWFLSMGASVLIYKQRFYVGD